MNQDLPSKLDRDCLCQLSSEELVEKIIEQAIVIQQLQAGLEELKQEIERLRVSRDIDSKTSSKPPSGDLLKKPETKKPETDSVADSPKRKPGGKPGHAGKTRKGFGRVDRCEILRPKVCACCGHTEFATSPVKVETQQVDLLVECPIEKYSGGGAGGYAPPREPPWTIQSADWSKEVIPGQDLGVRLQAFLGWMGNYGHLPYQKQQEMIWELGQIEIGVGTLVATNERVST